MLILTQPNPFALTVVLLQSVVNNGSIFLGFDIPAIITLLIIILLLFFSGMISGSEVAFFSLSPSQIEKYRKERTAMANHITDLINKPKMLLATILIANNLVNVGVVILTTYLSARLFDFRAFPYLGFLIQVIIITAIILLFGEIIPKVYATRQNQKMIRRMVRPLRILIHAFYPLSRLLVYSTGMIDRRISKKQVPVSLEELSDAIKLTSGISGNADETNMLKGIVRFSDTEVREIMKSRVDVVAVDEDINYSLLMQQIIASGYSRIPVFKGSADNVIGILYIKDLLPHLSAGSKFEWNKLIRPVFFIPENKKINDLLVEFQEKKIHMAVIVDEFGGMAGIVTLEDIIEEIVGEINDEFDAEADNIAWSKVDDNTWLFEGKTLLNDFTRITGIDDRVFDSVEGEYETLAGLILELEGRLPHKGESIYFEHFVFGIESADNRRIKRIKVSLKPKFNEN